MLFYHFCCTENIKYLFIKYLESPSRNLKTTSVSENPPGRELLRPRLHGGAPQAHPRGPGRPQQHRPDPVQGIQSYEQTVHLPVIVQSTHHTVLQINCTLTSDCSEYTSHSLTNKQYTYQPLYIVNINQIQFKGFSLTDKLYTYK